MDNIFGTRFAERGGYAWHGIGHRLEGVNNTAVAALGVAQADFEIITLPQRYTWNGRDVYSNQVAIARPPVVGENTSDPIVLGYASREYRPITNREICELLDEKLTKQWPVETIGALGKGEQFFVTLKAGNATIAGDEMEQYYFVYNSHDGTGALKIMFTPIRVVCYNTCILGMRQASIMAPVIHTGQVKETARFAMDVVEALHTIQSRSMETLNRFPRIKLDADQIKRVLRATYPDKPQTTEELVEQAEAGQITLSDDALGRLLNRRVAETTQRAKAALLRKTAAEQMVEFNDERPAYANTAWALYQSITKTESWREGGTAVSLGKSVMMGERRDNMARAFDSLVALAN